MDEPFERLQAARARAGYGNPTDAARAFGWNEITYRAHEAGNRGLKHDTARRYAKAFRVTWSWLLTGQGGDHQQNVVGVVGNIGAGGSIDTESEQIENAEPLFEIEVPFPVPSDAIAFQVQGESMWPRYDSGDVIVCYRHSQDPLTLLGGEVAAGTPEGSRYLKRLLRGSEDGLYNLESHNAAPIRDVKIAWVSEVFGVVRAARWRRLDDKGRRREMRKSALPSDGPPLE